MPVPADAAAFTLLKEQLDGGFGHADRKRSRRYCACVLAWMMDEPEPLEEVGKEFNVTRERIRQIEAKALRKLRHPSRSRKLKDYLD